MRISDWSSDVCSSDLGPEFYAEHDIDLRLGCEVTAIDAAARQVHLGTGERLDYGALLLATGAEPRRLPLPGFDRPNVFALRSLADARAIIAACANARSEEHTSELQSLMRISYAVFCLKKKTPLPTSRE